MNSGRTGTAVKMHTLPDYSSVCANHRGKVHDVNAGRDRARGCAFYVMDRGYIDFRRLFPSSRFGLNLFEF